MRYIVGQMLLCIVSSHTATFRFTLAHCMLKLHFTDSRIIGASMSEPHIDELNMKNPYVCMYLCMYVCKFDTNSTYSDSDPLR